MPRTAGSRTSRSTASMSGPVGVMGIGIMVMPKVSDILKWRS